MPVEEYRVQHCSWKCPALERSAPEGHAALLAGAFVYSRSKTLTLASRARCSQLECPHARSACLTTRIPLLMTKQTDFEFVCLFAGGGHTTRGQALAIERVLPPSRFSLSYHTPTEHYTVLNDGVSRNGTHPCVGFSLRG